MKKAFVFKGVSLDLARGAAVFCSLAFGDVFADTFRWCGGDKDLSGKVNPIAWSDATMWKNETTGATDVLPGATDDVYFPVVPTCNVEFDVTPPADFAGTIEGRKYESSYGLSARVQVTPAQDAAAYRLRGSSTFVANEALAEHLDASFSGCIEIPSGVTFTATAQVPDAVDFIGAGTLVLTKAVQLQHIDGMTGTVDARQIGALQAGDAAFLEGHEVILPASTSLGLSRSLGVREELPDWNVPGAWQMASKSRIGTPSADYTPNESEPVVAADGSLLMTDDFGQMQSATLKNFRFRYSDVWQVKFTWVAEHPEDAHPRSLPPGTWARGQWGNFSGAFFAPTETIGLPADSDLATHAPPNSYGMRFYNYREANTQGFHYIVDGSGRGVSDSWTCILREWRSGINMTKPVDVTYLCRQGVLYVTIEQEGRSRSFRLTSTPFSLNDSCCFGFYAATGTLVWQRNRFSNFRGWRLSRNAGQWKDVTASTYSLTPDNWALKTQYKDGDVTSEVSGAVCLDAEGGLKLLAARNYWKSTAVCQTAVPMNARFRLSYSIIWGARADRGGEGMRLSLAGSSTPPFADGLTNWDIGSEDTAVSHFYYSNLFGLTDRSWSTTDASHYPAGALSPKRTGTATVDLYYDGRQSMSVEYASDGQTCAQTRTFAARQDERYPNGIYPTFVGASTSWGCYHQTTLKDFKVYQWDAQTVGTPVLGSGLQMAAGTTGTVSVDDAVLRSLTLGAGSSVTLAPREGTAAIDLASATVDGNATLNAGTDLTLSCTNVVYRGEASGGLTATGAVGFGSQLTLTVPYAWRKARAKTVLLDATGATGALPSDVRLVYDTGAAVPEKYIRRAEGLISLEFRSGMFIVVE